MKNKGIYLTLWKKYLPVIKILLKKTDTETQVLTLYKHELQKPGTAENSFTFSLKILSGKPGYKTDSKAAAFDLLTVLNENPEVEAWLKTKKIQIAVDTSCKMTLTKIE